MGGLLYIDMQSVLSELLYSMNRSCVAYLTLQGVFNGFSKRSASSGCSFFDIRCGVPRSTAFRSQLLCYSDLPLQSRQFGLGLYCEVCVTRSWRDSSDRRPLRLGLATRQRSEVKAVVRAVEVRPDFKIVRG